ncbi:tRNA-splicing endonuclease positive effector [Niveomyces insectorum RCEF 264]|uniref:tRNA-splicing endonuclease positive effector n=1 Tax=Niveomyces insectorum RCEF 264 TaxID=1081102 RepID=A0A167TB85_9HYPO|nr:tRNA-splicing endonuclease positive effector [Niveomyces insectorum RCEF 264]
MPYDIDNPDNVDHIFAAMKEFMAKNTVGGVFQSAPGGPNYNHLPVPARLQAAASPDPVVIVRFDSMEHFGTVHKAASEFEDVMESSDIDAFNKEENAYDAWPLLAVPSGDDEETWVFLVEPKPNIEARLPKVGETCDLCLVSPDTGSSRSVWWPARRTHNNFAAVGKDSWSHLIVFNITLTQMEDESASVVHALIPNTKQEGEHEKTNLKNLVLNRDNSVRARLFFTKSDATFCAEMTALSKLIKAANPGVLRMPCTEANLAHLNNAFRGTGQDCPWPQQTERSGPGRTGNGKLGRVPNPYAVQQKQVAAFKYLIDFGHPELSVDMFEIYPHMREPDRAGSGIPQAILKKYRRMNEHQKQAYRGLLTNLPCGLGFLPGGPGSGKTDWVMTVVGLMQSTTDAKVLYLLDINDPLDDATAKYIKLMKQADLPKRAIRMRNFGTELRKSVRVGAQQKNKNAPGDHGRFVFRVDNSDEPDVDFSKDFLRLYAAHASSGTVPPPTTKRQQHVIPTLDEAAWDHFEQHKDHFPKLVDLLETCNDSAAESRALRFQIYQLYKTVLHLADFVATTPCVAGTVFHRMFVPDLVVFDEAAHARELSTLIAVANFCPTVGWLFIGDHRQTQPTVKSNNTNPHGKQLATSAMERAYLAGVLQHQLLINHRAFGRLERLPSKLIYESKMVSGIALADRFPLGAKFVRRFFEGLSGQACSVPRLVVHLPQVGRPVQIGTSWFHPQHTEWTMQTVLKLVQSKHFRSAENPGNAGTILLLAPYKAAVTRYQAAIEALATAHPHDRIRQRVEARTWDSAQGHEADVVGIDYVREHPTDFMDGMYRFNVGLTRARQGEWHLMHPHLPISHGFRQTKYLRKLYRACAEGLDGKSEGRVVSIPWNPMTKLVETKLPPPPSPLTLRRVSPAMSQPGQQLPAPPAPSLPSTPGTMSPSSETLCSSGSLDPPGEKCQVAAETPLTVSDVSCASCV